MEAQSPDSAASSPRSRNTDSWDEPQPPATTAASNKLRLMCSYGGQIVPRPQDKSLCYVGGDTRIVVVDRHTSLSDLTARLSKSLLNGRPFVLKYQLPSEDLDSLVSVTTDEDLDNMIDEHDHRTNNSAKPSRIRLFLFPAQPDSPQPIGPGPATVKPEDWFLNALNDGGLSVNYLLGLNDDEAVAAFNNKVALKQGQDVQSVPDSPMLETNSSFGSTSSSPSVANLPPIGVRVEDSGNSSGGGVANKVQDQKVVGIEEQFTQLGVGGVGQKQDGGFFAMSSPPPTAGNVSAAISTAAAVVSDDEKSEHGVPVEYIKPPTSQPQTQTQVQALPPQFQQKSAGVVDLPSPDSLSSDSSLANAMSRPKPVIYQDQVLIQSGTSRVPITSVDPNFNVSDPHGQIQMQQQHVQDPGYVLQQQFDLQQQHVQDPGYVLQQQYDPQQQAQQFIHGTHLIHHTPSGPVPIPGYYPVYQPQFHPLDQQYPVYYVTARQAPAYNLSAQQVDVGESATTNLPNPAAMVPPSAAYNPVRNAALPKPEVAAGAYRTAAATPQLVQVPASQHQQRYVAHSQIHHPSQSMAPGSAAPANYAYDYADSSYAQMFYAQPSAPSMPSQYQAMLLPEVSAQLPSDSMKQQIRTSQPL